MSYDFRGLAGSAVSKAGVPFSVHPLLLTVFMIATKTAVDMVAG